MTPSDTTAPAIDHEKLSGEGVVQGALRRLYDRMGSRLVLVAIAGGLVMGMINTAITGIWFGRYLGVSTSQLFVLVGVGAMALVTGGLIGIFLSRDMIRRVLAWSGDGRTRETAPETWNVLVRTPFVVVTRACLCVAVLIPGYAVWVVAYLGEPAYAVAPTAGSFVAGVGWGWVMITFGAELFVRPMLEDVAAHLPPDFKPNARTWRLQTKAIAPLPVVIYIASLSVGAFVNLHGSGTLRLTIALVVALGIVVPSAALLLVVRRSVLDPLGELTAATRRVRAGDFTTPVPLVSADDLGELAYDFNQMLQGLQERESLREHNVELDSALQASLDDVRRQAGELRESRARIVAAGNAERRRVERDLHDGAQQYLVLLGLKLSAAQRTGQQDPQAAVTMLEELRADLDRALAELRDLAHGIYPPLLENEGLPGALGEAVRRAALPASFDCDGAGRYPPELEAAVYFCCLEALQNAAKHAGDGASARVELGERDDALEFTIADDGRGYDPAVASDSAGTQNMADRIGALGGSLQIDSSPGHGTKVSGRIPLASDAQDPGP
jgi:signal transduction histidine kinase